MRVETIDIRSLVPNSTNPRKINKTQLDKLKKSITEFPNMLEIRPIVVDETMTVLAGNMRLRALIELEYDQVPYIQIENLTEEQKKEFIVKDNLSYGDWDWDILNTDWDIELLEDWGLEVNIDEESDDEKYTRKIVSPTYEPLNSKPVISNLVSLTKTNELIDEIKNSNITDEEKEFLIFAAYRHIVFDYSKIADYYAHSSKDMQYLMEKSALIIIDYNKAIEEGYVKLSKTLMDLYTEDYGE